YARVHRPLTDERREMDRSIAQLTQQVADLTTQVADTRKDAEAGKAVQADLQKSQTELAVARAYVANTAAQRDSDDKLIAQLKQQAKSGDAEVKGADGQITLTMVDRILFKSGVADLTPEGEELLRKLGGVFQGTDKLIEVCGHADNQPVESQLK